MGGGCHGRLQGYIPRVIGCCGEHPLNGCNGFWPAIVIKNCPKRDDECNANVVKTLLHAKSIRDFTVPIWSDHDIFGGIQGFGNAFCRLTVDGG